MAVTKVQSSDGSLVVATATGPTVTVKVKTPVVASESSITGYTLVNGTGTAVTGLVVPNDGKMHGLIYSVWQKRTATVGGRLQLTYRGAGSTVTTHSTFSTGNSATLIRANTIIMVKPGQTITIKQTSALTAGAAKAWIRMLLY